VKHFSDEDWLDFVRDVLPRPRRAVLEGHLHEDCTQCLRSQSFWENVRDVASRHARSEVPPEVIEAEEGLIKSMRRRSVLPAQARRALPIYDSLLVPLMAGVRSTGLSARRVVHRWNQWTVDLRIETEPGDRLSLAGQVLRPGWRPLKEFNTGVLLMSRDTVLQETGMNQFGEFQFTVQGAPDLTIFIELPQQHPIAIDLPPVDQPLTLKKRGSV
jgi:hypothetical protein